jgi:hypothetical protein
MANRAGKSGGNRSGGNHVERSTENSFPRRVDPGSQATSRERFSQQQPQQQHGNTMIRNSTTDNAAAIANAAHERRKRKRLNPCCTCYRTSTCARAIFARGDGTNQGCECKTAGRKCTSCACKARCRNLHHAPTPRSSAPSGISSFFNRSDADPDVPEPEPDSEAPEPASPEPDSEDPSATRPDSNTNIQSQSEDDTAEDEDNDDDYLTATQTSVDNGEDDARDYGEERGWE